MALTQMQLIQSLGEAMAWFERELQWGVAPTELRHLVGRIGELYVAMTTNGQLANRVNQPGYDVVSEKGERISVKTTARQAIRGQVLFRETTLAEVDRIIVLRVNTEDMQVETLLDELATSLVPRLQLGQDGMRRLQLAALAQGAPKHSDLRSVREVTYQGTTLRELENGTIQAERNGGLVTPVKPVLRELAPRLNVSVVSATGITLNTRQLGSLIIRAIVAEQGEPDDACEAQEELTEQDCFREDEQGVDDCFVRDEAEFEEFLVQQMESGTIRIFRSGDIQTPTHPFLREIADRLNVPVCSAAGARLNTRVLGVRVLRAIHAHSVSEITGNRS